MPKPTVSVVVPVYNALPYLTELLDSLAAQDIEAGALNVVTVDDGSTDGSADALDDYCRRHEHFSVIHQTNSRRPGRPRNVGLRASESTYVFFADADDRLAPECLRRLVTCAEEQGSDVVIPKMVPLAGRGFPTAVYEKTLLDADLVTAFRTLFPQKLYRRSLLTAHDIWFPEGIRLDDGNFNAQAYVHAKRISILSDYDYYFLRARKVGRQLSRTERDPVSYTASVVKLLEIVREHVKDPVMADQVVLDLYRRKCLHEYEPRRFSLYDAAIQDAWIAAHKSLVERFISEPMERRLESPFRERSYFIRRGDRVGLLESSGHETAPVVTATVTRAELGKRRLGGCREYVCPRQAWSPSSVDLSTAAPRWRRGFRVSDHSTGRGDAGRRAICPVRGRPPPSLDSGTLRRRVQTCTWSACQVRNGSPAGRAGVKAWRPRANAPAFGSTPPETAR